MHWRYFKSVIRHKWFVFWACLDLGVPILSALIHDWDKLTPGMWLPYARYFHNGVQRRDASGAYVHQHGETLDFDRAWNGHQKRNKHHWQYWVCFKDDGAVTPLPIPDVHRREMLADWIGAGRAYNPDWTPLEPCRWYEKHKAKMQLHPETREWVESALLMREKEYRQRQMLDI